MIYTHEKVRHTERGALGATLYCLTKMHSKKEVLKTLGKLHHSAYEFYVYQYASVADFLQSRPMASYEYVDGQLILKTKYNR